MTEFGHHASIGNGFCLDAWGSGPFLLAAGGKSFRFEDSDRFGPVIITKAGDVSDQQPSGRSAFWSAHRQWVQQGRQLAEDGITCVYDPAKPTMFRKIGKKTAIVVEHGDEGGNYVEVKEPPSRR